MSTLKPIARESIPRALAKAERYRLLNEPREAESICLDVLAIDHHNQDATICLILSLTDLFHGIHARVDEVRPYLERLSGDYDRAYFAGVIDERWAKALHEAGYARGVVRGLLHAAMSHFEKAEALAPPGNDDAVLRWNTCARLIDRYGLAEAETHEPATDSFDDDVPAR